jgi:hypothetical protein
MENTNFPLRSSREHLACYPSTMWQKEEDPKFKANWATWWDPIKKNKKTKESFSKDKGWIKKDGGGHGFKYDIFDVL